VKVLKEVLKPSLRGPYAREASLILDWAKIVSPAFSSRCYPEKLLLPRGAKGEGTLVIAADASSSLLIQHSQLLLIECINAYFGYKLVGSIRIKHRKISPVKKQKDSFLPHKGPISSPEDGIFFKEVKDKELELALLSFKGSYEARIERQGNLKVEK
jgi:hypothetical protein